MAVNDTSIPFGDTGLDANPVRETITTDGKGGQTQRREKRAVRYIHRAYRSVAMRGRGEGSGVGLGVMKTCRGMGNSSTFDSL